MPAAVDCCRLLLQALGRADSGSHLLHTPVTERHRRREGLQAEPPHRCRVSPDVPTTRATDSVAHPQLNRRQPHSVHAAGRRGGRCPATRRVQHHGESMGVLLSTVVLGAEWKAESESSVNSDPTADTDSFRMILIASGSDEMLWTAPTARVCTLRELEERRGSTRGIAPNSLTCARPSAWKQIDCTAPAAFACSSWFSASSSAMSGWTPPALITRCTFSRS